MIPALGPHWGFIVASYAIFAAVVLGLILWVVSDHWAQKKALADLEARGIRRRSDARDTSARESQVPKETIA